MKVLLSIKPEFVDKIFNGNKKYEYRRAIFKNRSVDTVIVYATLPIGKIVGEFKIAEVISDAPNEIWEKTKESSGITSNFFYEYFKNRNRAFAIEIRAPILYREPINPRELFEKFTAPQSFMYWI